MENLSMEAKKPRSRKKTLASPYEATKPPAAEAAPAKAKRRSRKPITPEQGTAVSGEILPLADEAAPFVKIEPFAPTEDMRASAQYLLDKQKREANKKASAEMEQVVEEFAKEHSPAEAEFTEEEKSWFSQGEDESHVKALAEQQHAADARAEADVRRHIAESYDDAEKDVIIDTDEEVEAAAAQAETMLSSGELPKDFNLNDYRYLLVEEARLNRELEHAGWWQARKLRAELRDTQKELSGYVQQIHSVHSERASSNDRPRAPEAPRRAAPKPMEGSGTYVKKRGFFSRLFGR